LVDGSLKSPYKSSYSIRHNWTFFASSYRWGATRQKCQDSLLSGEGRSLGAKISGGRGHPWGIFLVSTKPDTFCYLTVQTALCLCYVASFWHSTAVWQTDGRTNCRS